MVVCVWCVVCEKKKNEWFHQPPQTNNAEVWRKQRGLQELSTIVATANQVSAFWSKNHTNHSQIANNHAEKSSERNVRRKKEGVSARV